MSTNQTPIDHESYKSYKWLKMADWCKKNGLSPYVAENWDEAEKAIDEEIKKEIMKDYHENGLETLCSPESYLHYRTH